MEVVDRCMRFWKNNLAKNNFLKIYIEIFKKKYMHNVTI